MNIYDTTVKSRSKEHRQLVAATTPVRAIAKAEAIFRKRVYSWEPALETHATCLGSFVNAGKS